MVQSIWFKAVLSMQWIVQWIDTYRQSPRVGRPEKNIHVKNEYVHGTGAGKIWSTMFTSSYLCRVTCHYKIVCNFFHVKRRKLYMMPYNSSQSEESYTCTSDVKKEIRFFFLIAALNFSKEKLAKFLNRSLHSKWKWETGHYKKLKYRNSMGHAR
jgi:hypothetical protein